MEMFLNPLAQALPSSVPFVGPETIERQSGRPFVARLGANESGFGMPPAALAAMRDSLSEIWCYADPENHDLRMALAQKHVCGPQNIIVGPGIDNLLGLLCRLTLDRDQKVVTSLGGYPTFNYHVAASGAKLIAVPYLGDHQDLERLLAVAQAEKPRLLYVSNPDNPMGSYHKGQDLRALIDQLPPETLLVLDEAYGDLAPEDAFPEVAIDHPQLIRFRTFSKAYGMAGARVGYGIGAAEICRAFDKIRDHFGMNRAAQIGALAALQDQGWLPHIRDEIAQARSRLAEIVTPLGLLPLPSATNFVTVDCGAGGDLAQAMVAQSAARGLFIRMPAVAPLNRCIRISLGPKQAMDHLAQILPEALKAARG